ncbi:MAG: DUF4446 family protein [Clostridiales bacterium]|jgi:hypothetical protein|nr:DUF4446 family protein [Bacillota bacterium]NLK03943.1 DUF4446 family protein [Clostridiales bacterium]
MNLVKLVEQNTTYIIFGLVGLSLALSVVTIILMVKQGKLTKRYKKFMKGSSSLSLEDKIFDTLTEINNLRQDSKKIHKELELINENLLVAMQKIAVVKYDAFMEMGGKLSFVLALLDKNNDGILLNSVHSSREGCYTYLKEIIKGESFLELSNEEREALEQAKKYNTFME